MLDTALDRVTSKRILAFFRDQLKTSAQRQKYLSKIRRQLKPAAINVLKTLAKGQFPEVQQLLTDLPVVLQRSTWGVYLGSLSWGVYLRIALPLVPGLPIIIYVGSSCCMTLPVGGMATRAYRHLYRLSSLERT